MNEEEIGKHVLDAGFHVHTVLGPGLLESVYEAAMAIELRKRGLPVEIQNPRRTRRRRRMKKSAQPFFPTPSLPSPLRGTFTP
jgi:GxxExxY protein